MLLEMKHLPLRIHVQSPRDALVLVVQPVPHLRELVHQLLERRIELGLDHVVVAVQLGEVDGRFDELLVRRERVGVFL